MPQQPQQNANAIIPSKTMNHQIFRLCRTNQWQAILQRLEENPALSLSPILMENHIVSSIAHQAISSKGCIEDRVAVLNHILTHTPQAAQMRNGYGSLPLHVIAQRNTKMKSKLKQRLMERLVKAYPEGLTVVGGVGKRTPLHILFTDYTSPQITQLLVTRGPQACFMVDKKGFLPAHVACSRHCSPVKLQMLLEVNPDALFVQTDDGDTLLSLAKTTATKTHPNYLLIRAIQDHLRAATATVTTTTTASTTLATTAAVVEQLPVLPSAASSNSLPLKKRKRTVVANQDTTATAQKKKKKTKKARRMEVGVEQDTANLLLQFSRAKPAVGGGGVEAVVTAGATVAV